jgi:hypothetical protein
MTACCRIRIGLAALAAGLMRNDGGWLTHGSRVTLIVGGLRLEHLVVL